MNDGNAMLNPGSADLNFVLHLIDQQGIEVIAKNTASNPSISIILKPDEDELTCSQFEQTVDYIKSHGYRVFNRIIRSSRSRVVTIKI